MNLFIILIQSTNLTENKYKIFTPKHSSDKKKGSISTKAPERVQNTLHKSTKTSNQIYSPKNVNNVKTTKQKSSC